jgi:hypothetical protein
VAALFVAALFGAALFVAALFVAALFVAALFGAELFEAALFVAALFGAALFVAAHAEVAAKAVVALTCSWDSPSLVRRPMAKFLDTSPVAYTTSRPGSGVHEITHVRLELCFVEFIAGHGRLTCCVADDLLARFNLLIKESQYTNR